MQPFPIRLKWSNVPRQSPQSRSNMNQFAGIAQNLELLSNFLFNVAIARMKFSQAGHQLIKVLVGKLDFIQKQDGCENIGFPITRWIRFRSFGLHPKTRSKRDL